MMALKDKPDVPFRVPPGIKLINVDPKTGLRTNATGSILEAFKPGTGPPDSYLPYDTSSRNASPESEHEVGTGTGGLY